jgi:hypothetical protein
MRSSSDLDRSFGRLLHVNDDDRFDTWIDWLGAPAPPRLEPMTTRVGRLQLMLFAGLGHRKESIATLGALFAEVWSDTERRDELRDLLLLLRDRSRASTRPLTSDRLPLHSHADYGLYEIIAGFGSVGANNMLRDNREGVLWLEEAATDLFFITLEKSEQDYSATTRYRDYPISPALFHWESQSTTNAESATGRRYVGHATKASQVLLFVRGRKRDSRGETVPYTCLGYANYVRHESSRPMQVIWELERPMPAAFYQEAKVAAG